MQDRQAHWENVYSTKGEAEVSWFEDVPSLSLDLLQLAGVTPEMSVIDIGGGASRLVDELAGRGQRHIGVLDLSSAALEKAKQRLPQFSEIEWIVGDVTTWQPSRRYDVWHDRAAFHFLTNEQDQRAYRDILGQALKPGGRLIIGTFAKDGPEKCSGLPVMRYDATTLSQMFGPDYSLMADRRHVHMTPWGATQNFQFAVFAKLY